MNPGSPDTGGGSWSSKDSGSEAVGGVLREGGESERAEGTSLDEEDLRVDALNAAVAEAVLEGGVDVGAHPSDAPHDAHRGW